jgi:hypothetical protein
VACGEPAKQTNPLHKVAAAPADPAESFNIRKHATSDVQPDSRYAQKIVQGKLDT